MKKKVINVLISLVCAVSMLTLTACGGSKAEAADTASETEAVVSEGGSEAAESGSGTEYTGKKYEAVIKVKDYGDIKVDLYADAAPISVENFVKLSKDGFYDGLTFHRIISGFMIQGGDPLGNGTGGSDENIKGEFASNGVENNLSHTRGAISMARSADPDSASSQFFIVHEDSEFLNGEYACFGYVTEGMDVVDKICENTPVQDSNGTVASEDQPVIESITITE